MAGNGPLPNAQKRRRNAPAYPWRVLPREGRQGPPPKLPTWHKWHPQTVAWWKGLWATPQATQWDQDGLSLWVLAVLTDDLITGRIDTARVSAEIRQHEDRHGLNPKACAALRWVIGEDEGPTDGPTAPVPIDSRRRRMQLADPHGDPA